MSVVKKTITLKPQVDKPPTLSQDALMQDVYKKLEQRQHILDRPGMYIGSVESFEGEMFIYDTEIKQMIKDKVKFVPGLYKLFDEILVNMRDHYVRIHEYMELQKQIKDGKAKANPKIYLDHKYRVPKNMEIKIDTETGQIICRNDGEGVDIFFHDKEQMYIPELIFGNLLSGANFEEGAKRHGAGLNGLGSKLVNLYSTEFIVETVDSYRGLKYTQRYTNNMIRQDPVIEKYKGAPYTQIMFVPDFVRFGLTSLKDDDTVKLMQKRAFDLAGVTSKDVNVTYNGEKIDIKTFERYVDLYIGGRSDCKRQYIKVNDDWELVVCVSPDNSFEQISFVNGICTYKGGKHVDHVATIIAGRLLKYAHEKKKGMGDLTLKSIKDNLWIFVNATLINPEFDSQTKENLFTNVNKFPSKCDVSDEFIEKLADTKMGILEKALKLTTFKAENGLKKTDGKKRSKRKSLKTIDAEYAGSKKSHLCTLILTEGDSAQSLAISGISALPEEEQKYYGVMPLKGKGVNPKDCKVSKIEKNDEFIELKNTLGLKQGADYSQSISSLNYGRIMIMCDSDVDGDHIKGLTFNLFHEFWISLLKRDKFFCSLLTPIAKLTHNTTGQILSFYSLPDYEHWKHEHTSTSHLWTSKYYKGLGTSTALEAKEYFLTMKLQYYSWTDLSRMIEHNQQLENMRLELESLASELTPELDSHDTDTDLDDNDNDDDDDELSSNADSDKLSDLVKNLSEKDSESLFLHYYKTNGKHPCDLAIQLAFSKKNANYRKGWLSNYLKLRARQQIDLNLHKLETMSYYDFINEQLIEFSVYDNERNIPSIVDGLKPGQRKIICGTFRRKLKKEIKVAQLSGYVSEHMGYHHGEDSLNQTIISLAQDYSGSNNLNILMPNGQFGTRFQNGKDAASPRYIFTETNPMASIIFNSIDENLLEYMNDDGDLIEPRYYIPTICMALVNPSRGIGTGWSSDVPSYNITDILANQKRFMEGQPMVEMTPYFRGFRGTIVKIGHQKYRVTGVYHRTSPTTIEITEIPVGTVKSKSLKNYKIFIESLIIDETEVDPKKKALQILDDAQISINELSLKCILHFSSAESLNQLISNIDQFEKTFKLTQTLNTSNMHLFNAKGIMTKYESPEAILLEYCQLRLGYYGDRKKYLLSESESDVLKINEKIRFITYFNDDNHPLKVQKKSNSEIIALLESFNFVKFGKKQSKMIYNANDNETETDGNETETETDSNKPNYNYLLSLPISSLTLERMEKLIKERDEYLNQYHQLQITTIQTLWTNDMNQFNNNLSKIETSWNKKYANLLKLPKGVPRIPNHLKTKITLKPIIKTKVTLKINSPKPISDIVVNTLTTVSEPNISPTLTSKTKIIIKPKSP